MPSPFPGMNPYLEQSDAWEDFHTSFIVKMADKLNHCLGGEHFAQIKVRQCCHPVPETERFRIGQKDIERQRWLEIRHSGNRRVITVIELLSPCNKSSPQHRDDYLGKRNQIFLSPTNLVEIDLRRGGDRPRPPDLPACDYYVLVSRYEKRPTLDVWPIGLRQRLPVIPIPLSAPDPDIAVDLQELLHRVYDAANYGNYIYGEVPEPPLKPEDEAWARQLLQ